MDKLRVRAYNVRFGDALLVSVPDRGEEGVVTTRHILIDVGNVLLGEGGQDEAFRPVVEDILSELGGQPLDLYILTHEHMDHTQGLPYADKVFYPNEDLRERLNTRFAWLTASAAEDYYEQHPDAKKKHLALEETYAAIRNFLRASPETSSAAIETLLINNNPRSTKQNVRYLRGLAEHTAYVHREFDITGNHPFHETQFEIWAPEEDTSEYYGRFRPMAMGVAPSENRRKRPELVALTPPHGVDAGAFYRLIEQRQGYVENLLAIDKAANNTSVVFCLMWRGWKLLFTGDAERRSWKTMNKKGVLKPVHFLKVSHHGSHTGTPDPDLLDKVLPIQRQDARPRTVLVSTFEDTYDNVPDQATLDLLYDPNPLSEQRRCDKMHVLYTETGDGGFVDSFFEDMDEE
jgi:beta-lactamase superfamily II metal-dependent hydrolase